MLLSVLLPRDFSDKIIVFNTHHLVEDVETLNPLYRRTSVATLVPVMNMITQN